MESAQHRDRITVHKPSMNSPIPVLIVGGGPVGLALAGDLGWRGVRCLLIEQSDGSIYQPRQDLVGIRTMEFCRRWGLVAAVEASPYPRDVRQDNVYVTSLAGYELGRERFPSMGEEKPRAVSPQKRERCPQNMFDPILRGRRAALPHPAFVPDARCGSHHGRSRGSRARPALHDPGALPRRM